MAGLIKVELISVYYWRQKVFTHVTSIYGNLQEQEKRLHKKCFQLAQDWFGTLTWPPFHCFGTPRWPPWRHAETVYFEVEERKGRCCLEVHYGSVLRDESIWCILKNVLSFEAPRHKKWSHLEVQQRITHFFALFPQSLEPSMNLNISKLVYFDLAFSLRTADVFPVVASLHIFRRERSDDRKYVCCAHASPKQSILQSDTTCSWAINVKYILNSVDCNLFIIFVEKWNSCHFGLSSNFRRTWDCAMFACLFHIVNLVTMGTWWDLGRWLPLRAISIKIMFLISPLC